MKLRSILIPLSTLALVIGLTPAPAAAGVGWPTGWPLITGSPPTVKLSATGQPGLAGEPAADPAPPGPTTTDLTALPALTAADRPATTAVGSGKLRDVYSGLTDDQPAERPTPAAAGSSELPAGVTDEVRAAIRADGSASVIVRLHEQPDMTIVEQEAVRAGRAAAATTAREQHGARNAGQFVRDAERTARGRVVVDSLRKLARDSQPPVRAVLDQHAAAGRVSAVQEYWIFNGFAATVDATALTALAAHPAVASVTLDETIALEEPIPAADPGEPLLPVWSLESVNAPEVWGEYGVRGDGVVVGIMDSGVDGGHPALAGSWRGNTADPAASWYVPTGENYPRPGDGHGHGTHVAGSIVGAPPGEVTGVAPDAQWIAAKIFTDSGSTNDSIIHAAFQWMLAPGGDPAAAPHVVNNSWGSNATYRTEYWDAVAAWEAAGIVPIFSNGNSGPGSATTGSPASYPHAIGIGATDQADRIAWFSSRGPVVWDGVEYRKPQVSAPGYEIYSSWPTHLANGPYHTISGTSMAAPHATGVVALMLSAAPGLSVTEVREALTTTARAESHMAALPHAYGAGVIDAYAAVTQVAHAGAVAGTVTGPDGEPAAANVAADGRTVSTDPQTGGYQLWLPAGTHQLTVSGYGYQPWTDEVTITVGGTIVRDVTLADAGQQPVTGTVTGPAGPVHDARVKVVDTPVAAARTDADGRFSFTAAEGTYELRVTAAGHTPTTVELVVAGPTDLPVPLAAAAGPVLSQWPQHQNNPARTGQSGESLAGATLQADWTAHAGGEVVFASPVIADGRVFVNTDNGRLVALDAHDGSQLWTFTGSAAMRGVPAVADGLVYTGGGIEGGFHAVDATTGELVWTFPTPQRRTIYTTPVVADGVVYAATGFSNDRSDTVFALDAATGDELWSVDIGNRVFFGPALADGLVIATSAGSRQLLALDAVTGAQVWSLTREHDEFISGPSVADGTVYVTTSVPPGGFAPGFQGSLLAVDAATGDLTWEVDTHGDGQGTVPAVHGELVIAGSHGLGMVAAYHRDTGAPAWHFGLPTSGGVSASVIVSGDGYVIGGSQGDRRAFVLDATDGSLVWQQPVNQNLLASPAYADGRLVLIESNGAIRSYHPTGQVAGTVTGPDGPLAATVRVVETGDEVTADADTGHYKLVGLPPGDYTLEAARFGYSAQTEPVRVVVAQTTTVDFTLAAVGDGSLTGTVRDEAGEPLAGATVTLTGTPLPPAVTGDDGGYEFAQVAAGRYPVVADADGYTQTDDTVTITAGESTVADFTLARYDVAVVADYQGRVSDVLIDAGWRVDRVSFAQIDGTLDRYQAVVVVGMGDDRADADLARFAALVAQADQAGTSLVFLDTGGPSYGAIRTLSRVTGDPATDGAELSNRGEVWLEDVIAHPITASLPAGTRVPLLASTSWHAWFSDYTGHTLARLGNDRDGQRGDGIGYQRRTFDSNHILLSAAAPSPWSTWQPAVADLLVDAVSHAAAASYGATEGLVINADGEPVAATIEVVGGLERAVAGADGRFELILEPGEHTLRLRFLGSQTVERSVTVIAGQSHELTVSLPDATLGTIAGQVREQGSGAPIAGAQVTARDSGLPVATTGADGRYVIEDVPGGSYQLEFAASGYESLVVADVEVSEGAVTEVTAALVRAPAVVVVGDRNNEISGFLEEHSIPAEQAGWEIVDELAGVEVVILHNPPDPGRDDFLAALSAFDEAGVSVIFPADGWATRTRGVDLLSRHTGNPPGFGRIGGFSGPEIYLHNLADHPVFEGVDDDPVQLLTAASEAAHFPGYDGVVLADVALADADPAGIGIAYDVRTPDNVHLLLTGLAATLRNNPGGSWTPAGKQIFLNAVRWAAAPGQSGLAGTVTDPDGQPIRDAVVSVVDSHWQATTDHNGAFQIGVPPGEHTVEYHAFGYQSAQRVVTVGADQTLDISAELALGEVGAISGTVTSDPGGGGIDPAGAGLTEAGLTALPEVRVTLLGTPYETVTGPDGSYQFDRIASGDYELELEVDGHVRTLAEVSVTPGETSHRDVPVRVSPLIGIIDDSNFSNTRDRGKEFLRDWGYEVEDIGFDSLARIADLELVVANVSDFSLDLDYPTFAAFEEAVNRAGVPVLWLGQHGRGAIQFLHEHDGDPAVIGEGFNHGPVTGTVVEPHPLVAGVPAEFPLMVDNGRYTFFDEFAGTTVATLSTGADGERGSAIAYRGRTAGAVDVLLSTSSITTWGAPSTRQSASHNWPPAAERVLVNALSWALDAHGIGAEVRGTVDSDTGGRLASEVTVQETGRTYQGRDGDGSFLVPLAPGNWTLSVSAFGHAPQTIPVTVNAGEVANAQLTLAALPAGTVSGTVTGPDGGKVAGVAVQLRDTPLSTTTDADGRYTIHQVPDGDWTLRVTGDGYRTAQLPVSVTAGQTTVADLQLRATSAVAVVDTTGASNHGVSLANLLSEEGYEVELVPRTTLPELADRVDDYQLVIFNAVIATNQQAGFRAVVDAAAQAGVSTIFPSQFGGTQAIPQLSAYRNDPAAVDWGFVSVGIDYVPERQHPIFAGFPVGEPIPLLTSTLSNLNQQYGSYADFSGETIAHVHGRQDGADLGEAVGYQFSSPTSVELLLGSLAAGTYGWPDERWTDQARQIYLNAVGWAIDARQAELVGAVTSDGEPLAGAAVSSVELGATAITADDGSYALGLTEGSHTITVSAFGYATAEQVLEMPAAGTVTLDVDLSPLPRGEVTGTVDSATGEPVPGATLAGAGPVDWTATTGADGGYTAVDLLPGEYQVTVTAAGYLPATATVTVIGDQSATLDVTLSPTDIGVLGDVEGALTTYLREVDVPATELVWDATLDLAPYQVVVVNGGAPDAATFAAVLDTADESQVSLVFTGGWAVDRGGIRLLERYTDRVTVGAHGYGDGPVQLTGFDPEHPLFTGLSGDPATLIVEGGYYSVLDTYAGEPLADLSVTRAGADPVTGLAVGWDWRSAGSVEVLLSASAVTEAVGPGLGWTDDGGQLLIDAIEWARGQVMEPPAAPSLRVEAPLVVTESVTASGEAEFPSQLTVLRDGEPVATVDTAPDGSWSVPVPLPVGTHLLTAVATNPAGDSPASAPVEVTRWITDWEVRGQGATFPVTLRLTGPSPWLDPAQRAELVVYDADGTEVAREKLRWVSGFYLHVLRGLPPGGQYTLRAELLVGDHLLVIEGPTVG